MTRYEEITEARNLLELPERASLQQIKSAFRSLITKWHPDKCGSNSNECHEMTLKINRAYRTIITYCEEYEYSFASEEIERHLSDREWWNHRFGNDPLWGNNRQ